MLSAQVCTLSELAGHQVLSVNRKDGVKLLMSGDAFAMFRFSGTEPYARAYYRYEEPKLSADGDELEQIKSFGRIMIEDVIQQIDVFFKESHSPF